MAAATASPHPLRFEKNEDPASIISDSSFQPTTGSLVNVECRTWAGINKPGGVGRVTAVHYEHDAISSVDVKYVLGGTETNIDIIYIEEQSFGEKNDCGRKDGGRSKRRRDNNVVYKEKTLAKASIPVTPASSSRRKRRESGNKNKKKGQSTNEKTVRGKDDHAPVITKGEGKSKQKGLVTVTPGSSAKKVSRPLNNTGSPKMDQDSLVEWIMSKSKHSHNTPERDCVKSSGNDLQAKMHSSQARNQVHLVTDTSEVHKSENIQRKSTEILTNQTINEKCSSDSDGLKDISEEKASSSNVQEGQFLKNVYKEMTTVAATFVNDVVGDDANNKSDPTIASSSSSSTGSAPGSPALELKVVEERETKFTALLNEVIRRNMVDSLQIDEMIQKINAKNPEKPFSELEVRSYLNRLEERNRVMIVWDTQTVYII